MKRLSGVWYCHALTVLVLVAAITTSSAQHEHGNREFTAAMHTGMSVMIKEMESTPMTGDTDKDFLAMMIPHHEGAIEMARLALVHGRDPLVRRLAEEIIASQTIEIQAMKERLIILRKSPDPSPGGFPSLGGTRGEGKKHVTIPSSGK